MRRARLGGLLAVLSLLITACGGAIVERDVPYDDRFGQQTVMNLYLPGEGGAGRPGVMLIHGGGWRNGGRFHMRDLARRLARTGYVAANIEYRLAPEHPYPAAAQDSLCALAFFRAEAGRLGLDPDRVAVLGYSAGGHLAALIGVAPDLPGIQPDCAAGGTPAPAAVIGGAGVYDFDTDLTRDTFIVPNFMGGSIEELPEAWAEASPINHVEAGEPPFLMVAGTTDPLLGQQRSMLSALRAAGNDARLLVVPGSGHSTGPGAGFTDRAVEQSVETPEAILAIFDFLAETVGAP
ncbi:MAG: alpha/beta hydrolase [Deltaproteobacteria bacterium]|nr:alpha/beta hydrolase [Deltaproteobacteria bacterium]